VRRLLIVIGLVALAGCQKKAPEVQPDAAMPAKDTAALDAGIAPLVEAAVDAGPAASGSLWMVKDNRLRCIQAPCMSLDAMPVSSSDPTEKISDVDLSALGLSNDEQQAVMAELYGKRGLQLEGEIVEEPSKTGRGGMARVLKVSRLIR
jgi:hypothetical protein